jgi:hypothetical protein
MHRRRVLKIGVTLAALPLTSCGPSTPEPKPAPADATKPAGTGAALPDKPNGGTPEPAPTASNGAAAGAPGDAGKQPGTDAPKEEPKTQFSRVIGKVGKNHNHVFEVPFADVKAGAEKTYDIAGTSGHPHSVTLSAEDMKRLLAGEIVRTVSSKDRGHKHRVLARCAPAVDPPEWITVCDATFSGQDEHELVIPAADMAAKVEKTYDVQGIAGHAHEVTITAEGFEKLAKGEGLAPKTTVNDAHIHVLFIQYRKPKKA